MKQCPQVRGNRKLGKYKSFRKTNQEGENTVHYGNITNEYVKETIEFSTKNVRRGNL